MMADLLLERNEKILRLEKSKAYLDAYWRRIMMAAVRMTFWGYSKEKVVNYTGISENEAEILNLLLNDKDDRKIIAADFTASGIMAFAVGHAVAQTQVAINLRREGANVSTIEDITGIPSNVLERSGLMEIEEFFLTTGEEAAEQDIFDITEISETASFDAYIELRNQKETALNDARDDIRQRMKNAGASAWDIEKFAN